MKVCVFGASGYVGASVYQKLKDAKDVEVVGTYLEEPAIFDDLYKLDVNEEEAFSNFYKETKPDVVVWSVMDGPNEHELIDRGLINLITFLTPQTKLVYMSSDFVFTDGKGPYDEEDNTSKLPEDHIYSNYANAKVKAEHFITKELSNYVILRAGPIYGENAIGKLDQRTDELSCRLRSDQQAEFRNDLVRTFVHVEDLANVIVEFAGNEEKGLFHVGPEDKKSFYEFMQQMAEQMGYDPDLVKKGSEDEIADREIPKDISLKTEKIKEVTKQNFR
ncbi:sugar nucleotide-binding protein [Virgibacillus kekensis]|uniref:Sugar nucleotide-binding protein n=1 Tax=Virgibacillus kekensis TaxID=202261 RepID=A0ABV9DH30_9BACI